MSAFESGMDTIFTWALGYIGEILAFAPVTFIIVFVFALYVAGRIISTIRRAVAGGSGVEHPGYQDDFVFLPPFIFFWLFQGPTLPLPDITETDITDLIAQMMNWAPISFLLLAVVAVTVVAVLLQAFIRVITR